MIKDKVCEKCGSHNFNVKINTNTAEIIAVECIHCKAIKDGLLNTVEVDSDNQKI